MSREHKLTNWVWMSANAASAKDLVADGAFFILTPPRCQALLLRCQARALCQALSNQKEVASHASSAQN